MKKRDCQVSIVLPTYNERENIQEIIPLIYETFKNQSFEIIIVDDNSPDGTSEIARELSKKHPMIQVITRTGTRGIGAALAEGYSNARGNIIISSDADLSLHPSEMLLLLKKIDEGCDLIVGSKYENGAEYEKRGWKKHLQAFISRTGNIYMRCITGIPLLDFTLNFRAFRRELWNSFHTVETGNIMLLEMIYKAKIHGYHIQSIPVTFSERKYGVTKFQFFKTSLPFLLKTSMIGIKRVFKKNPEW